MILTRVIVAGSHTRARIIFIALVSKNTIFLTSGRKVPTFWLRRETKLPLSGTVEQKNSMQTMVSKKETSTSLRPTIACDLRHFLFYWPCVVIYYYYIISKKYYIYFLLKTQILFFTLNYTIYCKNSLNNYIFFKQL